MVRLPKRKKRKINKGAITAAAIAGAATVGVGAALSNEKTRKKLKKKVKYLKEHGIEEVDIILEQLRGAKIVSEKKIAKIAKILIEKEENI